MLPPVARQLTAVFELPVTVAVNCELAPGNNDRVLGVMATGSAEEVAETVIVAVAVCVVSATLVAVTV